MTSHPRSVRSRVTYRTPSVADLAVLVDHRHRMWSDIGNRTETAITEHDGLYRRWARDRLRSGELVGCVAETAGGSVVASGLVWFRPEQPRPSLPRLASPYLLSMYTEPAWRGQGIATRIVRDLLAVCRKQGYSSVELHASRFGRRLYGRLGFERTWEMRTWLDRRAAPRPLGPTARASGKGRKGLDRRR